MRQPVSLHSSAERKPIALRSSIERTPVAFRSWVACRCRLAGTVCGALLFLSVSAWLGRAAWPAGAPERGRSLNEVVETSATRAPDSGEPHNCRFWGLIGFDYPDTLIRNHLRTGRPVNLQMLGGYNRDGWGIGYFPPASAGLPLDAPVLRRGGPPAWDDVPDGYPEYDEIEPEYGWTVEEMEQVRPRAAIGHVRAGTSGHWGIPDPHPFQHRGLLFAHNGGVSVSTMEAYLGDYLFAHPPDYFQGAPSTGHIDSELYFLCLLKYIDAHPELDFTSALVAAVWDFVTKVGGSSLNFVMTNGDTLYALHYWGSSGNPIAYFPAGGPDARKTSPYWAVASEPLGGSSGWGTIPNRTLGVFVAGREPVFHPINLVHKTGGTREAAGEGPPETQTSEGRWTSSRPGGSTGLRVSPDTLSHQCRFWALIGDGYAPGMIASHLRSGAMQSLQQLASANEDGWGLGSFPRTDEAPWLRLPLVRRGGPPADDSHEPEYPAAVAELEALRPRAAIAHVRNATSGHWGIPNPHPFLHEGLLFAHNGALYGQQLQARLGLTYLRQHPPDYDTGSQGTGPIDSELYFLYLLKLVHERPELPFHEALLRAVATIADDLDIISGVPMLNFVLTRGDTLFALQFYGPGLNFEQYYPAGEPGSASPFWVVASESLGSGDGGWAPVPDQTLAMFVPGEAPRFFPVGPVERTFSLAGVSVTGGVDADQDGRFASFEFCCDANVHPGTAQVSITLFGRAPGEEWIDLGSTRYRLITEDEVEALCLSVQSGTFGWPDDLSPLMWELKLELREGEVAEPVLIALGQDHPGSGMDGFPIEGALYDAPDVAEVSFGPLEPNPSVAGFRLRLVAPQSASDVALAIFDSNGRRVWEGLLPIEAGSIGWSAPAAGTRLEAGMYVCRFSLDGRSATRRLVVVQ